jgi:hypothetical protein
VARQRVELASWRSKGFRKHLQITTGSCLSIFPELNMVEIRMWSHLTSAENLQQDHPLWDPQRIEQSTTPVGGSYESYLKLISLLTVSPLSTKLGYPISITWF